MPYIKNEKRAMLDMGQPPTEVGELTYVLYKTCCRFLTDQFKFWKLAAVMGALVCCGLEIYRRKGAPYENEKIEQNGDV